MDTVASESSSGVTRDVAVSTAIVEEVSSSADTPVSELPALTDVVDPDAVNELFAGNDADGHVEFTYAGHLVTVHAGGTIEVSTAE